VDDSVPRGRKYQVFRKEKPLPFVNPKRRLTLKELFSYLNLWDVNKEIK
jgi:hypothetical protein